MVKMHNKFKPRWQTWWMIVGPELPTSEIAIREGIYIAPLSDDDFYNNRGDAVPVPGMTSESENFVVRYPPRDVVQSRYRLQIDVPDVSEEEATEHARDTADRLLASLTLAVPGGRYHAQFRKIRRYGASEERSAWSQTVSYTPLSAPSPLSNENRFRALGLMDQLESNETAENSYLHLLTAWQIQDTPGSKPLKRSILQHYVLCIENVVNGVMKVVRSVRMDQIKLAEREFAKKFFEGLEDRADKPKALRDASTNLRMIGLQNTMPSIDAVAAIIGLSDDVRDSAKLLYRFRSSSLSHPGRSNKNDLNRWLDAGPEVEKICEADRLARSFLVAYCYWDKISGAKSVQI